MSKCLDVGGQAVIEGVMMRGPGSMVIAVRRADGSIVVKDSEWVPLTRRWKFLKWPVIRGAIVMIEALMNGMQSLSFSAEVAMKDEELAAAENDSEPTDSTDAAEPKEASPVVSQDPAEIPTGAMTQEFRTMFRRGSNTPSPRSPSQQIDDNTNN